MIFHSEKSYRTQIQPQSSVLTGTLQFLCQKNKENFWKKCVICGESGYPPHWIPPHGRQQCPSRCVLPRGVHFTKHWLAPFWVQTQGRMTMKLQFTCKHMLPPSGTDHKVLTDKWLIQVDNMYQHRSLARAHGGIKTICTKPGPRTYLTWQTNKSTTYLPGPHRKVI